MATTDFDAIRAEFDQRVTSTIWCTLATVDDAGRPRLRVVHPVWEHSDEGAPIGWIGSRPNLKLDHVEANPAVACMYWDPRHQQVTIDGTATVHRDDETRRHVWELFMSFDEPYGFDPAPIWP